MSPGVSSCREAESTIAPIPADLSKPHNACETPDQKLCTLRKTPALLFYRISLHFQDSLGCTVKCNGSTMEIAFTKDYVYLWALAMALALFFPVRKLIFVLYMRRAQKLVDPDEAETRRLQRRAGVTSALLCFVFSMLYSHYLFRS
jgi:hypothetical protein